MTGTSNETLTCLIDRLDGQQMQERLIAAYAVEERAESDLTQAEQAIMDVTGCMPRITLKDDQASVHAQFDLTDEVDGSTNDFIAPLLANRQRLTRELQDCHRISARAEAMATLIAAHKRRTAVKGLLEHWIYPDIQTAQATEETLVTFNLSDHGDDLSELIHLVLTNTNGLRCWLEDSQLLIAI